MTINTKLGTTWVQEKKNLLFFSTYTFVGIQILSSPSFIAITSVIAYVCYLTVSIHKFVVYNVTGFAITVHFGGPIIFLVFVTIANLYAHLFQ